jgi:hypothetical protein
LGADGEGLRSVRGLQNQTPAIPGPNHLPGRIAQVEAGRFVAVLFAAQKPAGTVGGLALAKYHTRSPRLQSGKYGGGSAQSIDDDGQVKVLVFFQFIRGIYGYQLQNGSAPLESAQDRSEIDDYRHQAGMASA